LEICEQKRIIHRDIKDENIFVTSDGKFKLGDFGIAKRADPALAGFLHTGHSPLYGTGSLQRKAL